MKNKLLAFFCIFFACTSAIFYFVGLNAYSNGYDKGYHDYEGDAYLHGYNEGYQECSSKYEDIDSGKIYSDAYDDGYDEGFYNACQIIIDRMDPDYREQWWQENLEDIEEFGIVY